MNEEKCKQLIAEIISGIDRGDFNDPARPAGNYIVNDKSIYTFDRLLRRICCAKH